MQKIRIGLIGCGLASSWHLNYLISDERVEIAGLADVSDENVHAALSRIPTERRSRVSTYRDYKAMLTNSELDAVLILTPHKFHHAQIKDSLQRGMHVLVEKPLTVFHDEGEEVVSLASKAKRILMVAYQYPDRGPVKYVHEAIRSGALGELTYFNAMLGIYWHKLAAGWRLDPEISQGGVLVDSGSHLVDLVLHLTGVKADEVFAYADYEGEKVDVYNTILVRFGNGRTGVLSAVGGGPFLLDLTIIGTRGAITMRDLETIVHVDEEHFIGELGTYHRHNKYSPDRSPGSTLPVQEFVDAVWSGNLNASNGERALRVSQLTEAVYESINTKKPVVLKD